MGLALGAWRFSPAPRGYVHNLKVQAFWKGPGDELLCVGAWGRVTSGHVPIPVMCQRLASPPWQHRLNCKYLLFVATSAGQPRLSPVDLSN